MKLLKVAAASLNQTPRNWQGNTKNILTAIELAKTCKASILCLPEASITGYGLEDDLFCSDIPHRALLQLRKIANNDNSKNLIISLGLPIIFNNALYNAIATIVDGEIIGFTCKQHLAGDGIHYEPRHYKPWPSGVVSEIEIPELQKIAGIPCKFPIGDIHFNVGGIKIGYEICEDAWVANRPGSILASKGIDIILNPSASHFAFGKINTRKNFVVDGSRAFNATYIYSNLVGNEAGRIIYDGGSLIATNGKLVAVGKRFTFSDVNLTTAVIDVDNTRTSQVRTASYIPNVKDNKIGCINYNFNYPMVDEPLTYEPQIDEWEASKHVKHEECTRALGLALMDYMRKSHTKGFTISLSGGSDSALVTYLCGSGIRMACNELGHDAFHEKYCSWAKKSTNSIGFINQLITTAYQATAQSGDITKEAAKKISEAIGTKHFEFEVQDIVDKYIKLGEKVKEKSLSFEEDDITLQNLQARVRSPSIWIIANMQNKLLLTTSNMSEAAVGYATMDGDTSGCVAPISGLSKAYIIEYLKWVEEFHMIEMHYINKQKPTAELRPQEYKQTDEDDLMPYWLLHQIETMVVKNRYIPKEIYLELRKTLTYDNNKLIKDIKKFFRLFSINQWKRERYALGFHMDDHNLDPRTWCRTPILTGGYEEELKELDAYLIPE